MSEKTDWIDTWRNGCGHAEGKDRCVACYSNKECEKAIKKIRKTLRGMEETLK